MSMITVGSCTHAATIAWSPLVGNQLPKLLLDQLEDVLLTIADGVVHMATAQAHAELEKHEEPTIVIEMDCEQLATAIVREIKAGSFIRIRGD